MTQEQVSVLEPQQPPQPPPSSSSHLPNESTVVNHEESHHEDEEENHQMDVDVNESEPSESTDSSQSVPKTTTTILEAALEQPPQVRSASKDQPPPPSASSSPPSPVIPTVPKQLLDRFQRQFTSGLETRFNEKQSAFKEQMNSAVNDLFQFFLHEIKSAYLANPFLKDGLVEEEEEGQEENPDVVAVESDSDSVVELQMDADDDQQPKQSTEPEANVQPQPIQESQPESVPSSTIITTTATPTTTTTPAETSIVYRAIPKQIPTAATSSYQAVPSSSSAAGGVGIIIRRISGGNSSSSINNSGAANRIRISTNDVDQSINESEQVSAAAAAAEQKPPENGQQTVKEAINEEEEEVEDDEFEDDDEDDDEEEEETTTQDDENDESRPHHSHRRGECKCTNCLWVKAEIISDEEEEVELIAEFENTGTINRFQTAQQQQQQQPTKRIRLDPADQKPNQQKPPAPHPPPNVVINSNGQQHYMLTRRATHSLPPAPSRELPSSSSIHSRSLGGQSAARAGQQMVQEEQLMNYNIIVHGLNCYQCGVEFKDRPTLNLHLYEVHGDFPQRCRVAGCLENFENGAGLTAHLQAVHPDLNGSYPCTLCPPNPTSRRKGTYPSHRALTDHQQKHHEEGRYGCCFKSCPFIARYRSEVRIHMNQSHGDSVARLTMQFAQHQTTNRAVHAAVNAARSQGQFRTVLSKQDGPGGGGSQRQNLVMSRTPGPGSLVRMHPGQSQSQQQQPQRTVNTQFYIDYGQGRRQPQQLTQQQVNASALRPYRCIHPNCGANDFTQKQNAVNHVRVVHFGLPRSQRIQAEMNIVDRRNAHDYVRRVMNDS